MTTKKQEPEDGAETYKLDWQGRKIDISYQPRSFAGTAHLQIRVKHARPLPITETGYRSHFASPADVAQLGGPVAYVEAWLDAMAETKAWKRTAQGGFQMTLF
jgi:hypothetical protein